jgi:hypothetical protein
VKLRLKGFIPPPLFAIPGVESLANRLVDQALDEGENAIANATKQIDFSLAAAEINLPAVLLKSNILPRPPALIGFKPPTGLAVNFGQAPATGGGALDYQTSPNQRLSGTFGMKIGIVQVAALAILEEAIGGFSMVTLLNARFSPGLQLGFGFAISGMGGLIGINRALDAGALEAQFRAGALTNALFGDDPIRNAIATLNTLSAVFRARMGAYIVGPSMQLSWLKVGEFTLFNVDLGVFMQFPGPSRIDIIGSAKAGILLLFQLRMDLRGELDFGRRIVGIHAVIVDSHVMGIFKLQGEAIFRMRYGDDPYVVLTIGGFFPGFHPSPAELPPNIPRVGMGLDVPNDLPIFLRAEGYLAVTSNTLQFGGKIEAGIDAGLFSADGHLMLDALFQFDPFAFDVRFSAGFHIRILGESFSGVECSGNITGPGPVVIHARISYETPFFLPDIDWSDTFTIGESRPRLGRIADLYVEMKSEIDSKNLRAENGDDPHVAIKVKGGQTGGLALLSPLGDLLWAQRLAPLGMDIERVQNAPMAARNGVVVTAPGQDANSPREKFSLGMYVNLSDAEKLNLNARVEEHAAGVRMRFGLATGSERKRSLAFYDIYRPPRNQLVNPAMFKFSAALLGKVTTRSDPAQVSNLSPKIKTVPETWRAGSSTFDTQAAAHMAARSAGTVAHLQADVVELGGL